MLTSEVAVELRKMAEVVRIAVREGKMTDEQGARALAMLCLFVTMYGMAAAFKKMMEEATPMRELVDEIKRITASAKDEEDAQKKIANFLSDVKAAMPPDLIVDEEE